MITIKTNERTTRECTFPYRPEGNQKDDTVEARLLYFSRSLKEGKRIQKLIEADEAETEAKRKKLIAQFVKQGKSEAAAEEAADAELTAKDPKYITDALAVDVAGLPDFARPDGSPLFRPISIERPDDKTSDEWKRFEKEWKQAAADLDNLDIVTLLAIRKALIEDQTPKATAAA